MKKISSKATFYNKRIFPMIWFGFIAVFFVTALIPSSKKGGQELPFIVFPAVMGVFGYFFMKKFVFDLMDEVYDAGTYLVVKNANKEAQIDLKNVKNISYNVLSSPQRVTLSLRSETIFGKEITFIPPASFIPFKKNQDIDELIDRVDKIRG